ncbi:MAG TPA: NAD(P)-dependent alcohol dehydrogenase [Casimicrobiaceae bacterium]|nr:NAD(P)-dependent alcohol dehydrogenase [Casimicrobiaceae bacterium]
MRALRYHRYGSPDVLQIEELPEPSPAAGQAKVFVGAVTLNPLDWKILAGHVRLLPAFRSPPRGIGCDFAGEIVGIGGGASERHVGERVFGSLLPFGRDGACSEHIVVPYERLLPLPAEVDDIQAAALPIAGGTALQVLTDETHLAAGQRVLITGAAGGVGHFAVQIAKHLGAYVVAVCSAHNADFARSLGADEVIDYATQDFTRRDERFDVVFDAACASSFTASRRVLTQSGRYVNTGGDAASVVGTAASAVLARLTSRQRAISLVLRNGPPVWQRLLDLVGQGTLRPHIERVISLDEVAEALRAMVTGHGRGKIVVRLASPRADRRP